MKSIKTHWNQSSSNWLVACSLPLRWVSLFIIKFYQIFLSTFFGGNCRFYPSCSEYGLQAFKEHTPVKAFGLTAKRICKCHPLSKAHGFDPVPLNMKKEMN